MSATVASAGDLPGAETMPHHDGERPRSLDTPARVAPRFRSISLMHVFTCTFAPFR